MQSQQVFRRIWLPRPPAGDEPPPLPRTGENAMTTRAIADMIQAALKRLGRHKSFDVLGEDLEFGDSFECHLPPKAFCKCSRGLVFSDYSHGHCLRRTELVRLKNLPDHRQTLASGCMFLGRNAAEVVLTVKGHSGRGVLFSA